MDSCSCIVFPTPCSNSTVSSQVTYDGSSLACISFSSGNMNALATAISLAICNLQSSVASITVNTNGTVLIGINTNCLSITNGQTVTSALNTMLTAICNLTTTLSSLTTDEINTVNITPVPNCLGITNGTTLTAMINAIISYLCHRLNGISPLIPIEPIDPLKSIMVGESYDGTAYRNPLSSYVKTPATYTDTSAGGQAQITFPALNFYVDNRWVDKLSEAVNLTNSADNYIFLDHTNGWVYNISAVAIGNSTPTVTGAIVCKVTTGVGTIATVTQIIDNYPIQNNLLDDNSVQKRNLNSNTVDPSGAIIQNSGAYKINVDAVTMQIVGNALTIKKVYKANIDLSVAGSGMIQNGDGSLSPNVGNSIVNVGGVNQLVGDVASGTNLHYGFSKTGAEGMLPDLVMGLFLEIPHAQILTMGTTDTPISLISCPTGKSIQIIGMNTYTKSGWTSAYATNTELVVYTKTAPVEQYNDSYILSSTVVRGIKSTQANVSDATSSQHILNEDVYVGIKTGDPTGGAAGNVLGIRVLYCIS